MNTTELLDIATRLIKAATGETPDVQILVVVGSILADRRAQLVNEVDQIDKVLKEINYYD